MTLTNLKKKKINNQEIKSFFFEALPSCQSLALSVPFLYDSHAMFQVRCFAGGESQRVFFKSLGHFYFIFWT